METPYGGNAKIHIYATKQETSAAAAEYAATLLQDAIAGHGRARIVVGTGPSQDQMIASLTAIEGIDWRRIEVFHMDEYVGMSSSHPASFRRWLREHLADKVKPAIVHYLEGDAEDIEAECLRYGALLNAAPIDISFIGFGENGHIAFNDPPVADFNDPLAVKKVEMDTRCRMQQVGEGHFATITDVPREALTLTCPALMAARYVIACVPELRKAVAAKNAIEGPISTGCPASIIRTHPRSHVYLDAESASLLHITG